ncbi:MAG: SDR family NAD(P)-dependent oxidoreductase [Pseudomonadota bacterium]
MHAQQSNEAFSSSRAMDELLTFSPDLQLNCSVLKGKVALVTGASRGLGFALCKALSELTELKVYACARTEEGASRAQEQCGVQSKVLDVTSPHECEQVVAQILQDENRIDVLVNMAGVTSHPRDEGRIECTDASDIQDVVSVNCFGPYYLIRLLLPIMNRNRWGRIVNVSSEQASLCEMGENIAPYKISKAGLNALTRVAAHETDRGVKVNSVAPGWCRTDMGGPDALRSIEQGVASVMWAVLLGEDGPNGGFYLDGKKLDW